jgi:sulfur-oxidizing protein SoxZ
MATHTKIRTRKTGDRTEVMVLIKHPMEAGAGRDPATGEPISAQYIETMIFELNGTIVAEARLGPGVAANPLTSIGITGARAGDTVTVRWTDNLGEGEAARATIG